MAILSDPSRRQLQERFDQELQNDVKITLFTQPESLIIVPGRECPACKETQQLLEEVAGLSDHIALEVHDFYNERDEAEAQSIDRIPAFLLEGEAKGRVRYFGIPAGHEFPSFIEDLVEVARGSTTLTESSRETLGALTRDVHIQVFITPT